MSTPGLFQWRRNLLVILKSLSFLGNGKIVKCRQNWLIFRAFKFYQNTYQTLNASIVFLYMTYVRYAPHNMVHRHVTCAFGMDVAF